jgi:NAD(P)-dependent dehydrogenase (short-subunit alcohol dehydrogenase family)
MAQKTWFITGTSRGFGREWAIAALERGDRVAATARNTDTLSDLVERFGAAVLPLELDVTDREADFAAVAKAHEFFGRLDVIVNNAGYGQFGFLEEVSEEQARAQIETNVFGAMWVTQAALPYLRKQGSGHIVQVSSIGGISAFPGLGLYHASKWALEGFSQSLAAEVAPFGISVTLIEPGGFDTDWGGSSAIMAAQNPDYDAVRAAVAEARKTRLSAPGSHIASANALLKVVDAEQPPLRVFFGVNPLSIAKADYASRIENWEKWNDVAVEAQG